MASEVKEEQNSTTDVKKDENVDEKPQDIDSSDKDDVKDSLKNESKEDSGKEESDEDDDEEVALLDRPVEVTGCRARKKVERLEISFTTPKEKQDFPEGKGKKLGECPRIEAQIQKMKVADLKALHRILFNRTGSANEIKKNIRKFCGFPFENDSSEFNRKKASVDKLTLSVLKQACLILDLERGGTKEDIVTRILTFLLNPEESGKKVPSKKKPSKDKKKSTNKKVKSEKKVKSDGNSEDDADENLDDDDSTGGEASMGGTDEENEGADAISNEDPKTKSKEIKSSKGKSKSDKSKKDEKKTKGTKRKIDEDSSDDSEVEKKAKKNHKMPSDEDISKLVKQILEAADLQEITMKKVIKQVSDAYPDFDLSHKKAFIKSTIKSM